jgi:hypothetical protein
MCSKFNYTNHNEHFKKKQLKLRDKAVMFLQVVINNKRKRKNKKEIVSDPWDIAMLGKKALQVPLKMRKKKHYWRLAQIGSMKELA